MRKSSARFAGGPECTVAPPDTLSVRRADGCRAVRKTRDLSRNSGDAAYGRARFASRGTRYEQSERPNRAPVCVNAARRCEHVGLGSFSDAGEPCAQRNAGNGGVCDAGHLNERGLYGSRRAPQQAERHIDVRPAAASIDEAGFRG